MIMEGAPKTDRDEALAFVADTIPAPLLSALRVLASLDYPIDDRPALSKAMARVERKDAEAGTRLIELIVGPPCFPLASPRNALEKLHARLPVALQLPIYPPPGPGIGAGPVVEVSPPDPTRPPPRAPTAPEEAFLRAWGCREDAWRRREVCMYAASRSGDPLAGFFCDVEYELALKDCGIR